MQKPLSGRVVTDDSTRLIGRCQAAWCRSKTCSDTSPSPESRPASLGLVVRLPPEVLNAPVDSARVDAATCEAATSAAPPDNNPENHDNGEDDPPDHDDPQAGRGYRRHSRLRLVPGQHAPGDTAIARCDRHQRFGSRPRVRPRSGSCIGARHAQTHHAHDEFERVDETEPAMAAGQPMPSLPKYCLPWSSWVLRVRSTAPLSTPLRR